MSMFPYSSHRRDGELGTTKKKNRKDPYELPHVSLRRPHKPSPAMLYPELICRIIGFCDASTLHVLTTVCRFFGMEAQNTLFRRHIAFNPQPGPKHNPNATELSRHDAWDGMQAEERKFNALGSTRPRICQLARHGTVIGSPTLIISYASGSPLYAEALEAFSFFLFQCPNIVELTIMGMPLDEKVLYFLRNLHGLHGGGMKLTLDSCWLAHEPKLVPDAKILSFKEVVISPSPLGMASLPIFMPIGLSIFCTTSLRKIDINHQDLFRALVNSVSRHEITLPRVTDARIGFTFHAGRMTDEECSGAESRIYTLLSAAPNITSLTLDCGDHAMLFNSFATHCANMVPRLTTFKGSIYAAQNLAAPRTRPLREVTIMTSMARKNIATLYLEKILPNAAHTLRELHLTVDSDGFPYLLATLHQHRQSRIKKVSILLERTPSNRFSKMVKVPLVKASHDVLFKMQRLRHPEDIEKFATNLSEDPSPMHYNPPGIMNFSVKSILVSCGLRRVEIPQYIRRFHLIVDLGRAEEGFDERSWLELARLGLQANNPATGTITVVRCL